MAQRRTGVRYRGRVYPMDAYRIAYQRYTEGRPFHAEARRQARALGISEGDILALEGAIQYSPWDIQFMVGEYDVRYWQAVRYYKYTSGPRSNWRAFEVRLETLPFLASWSRSQVIAEEDRIGRIMDRLMEANIDEAFPTLVKGGIDVRSKLKSAINLPGPDEIGWGEKDFGEVGSARARYRQINEGWEEGDTGTQKEIGTDVSWTITDKTGRYPNFPRRGRIYWEIPGATEES